MERRPGERVYRAGAALSSPQPPQGRLKPWRFCRGFSLPALPRRQDARRCVWGGLPTHFSPWRLSGCTYGARAGPVGFARGAHLYGGGSKPEGRAALYTRNELDDFVFNMTDNMLVTGSVDDLRPLKCGIILGTYSELLNILDDY